MIWQDLVLTIVNIVFSISLIPQVIHGFKEKKGLITLPTSIPTFIGLYVIGGTYLTMNLFFSSVMAFATGTLWFILFIQRLIYKEKK